MSKKGLSEIVCIIDRSGSMSAVKTDAIGGFNQFIEEQKNVPREANITLVLFDDVYEMLMDREPLTEAKLLTEETYIPRGMTALLDAIGTTVDKIGLKLDKLKEEEKPENIIVSILTDGYENASKDYTKQQIQEKIKHQQEKYNWQFIFLGANQDAFAEAASLNIPQFNAMNFAHDSDGTRLAYKGLSTLITSYRIR